jgi:23S rRNA pseudouridine1911/1915/1917 synthase
MSNPTSEPLTYVVEESDDNQRLDVFLAKRLTQYSRTQLRNAIVGGTVTVDGARTKVAYRLVIGQTVSIVVPELPQESPEPEDIPLDILYEDDHLVAINKPPGMVVHPAKGHWSGTLTSALAFHFQQLSSIGGPTRPGIVHRLDRDTSGVIVVAKNDAAHVKIAAQFEARTTHKQYFVVCRGCPDRDRDRITQPIGPHPKQREKMAIRENHRQSRDAVTEYEVAKRYDGFSIIHAFPKTGRTHQIRVHLAHVGCPVACDRLYASHSVVKRGELDRRRMDDTLILDRQALHAKLLRIEHPVTGQSLVIEAPIPNDIQRLIDALDELRSLS